MSDHPENHPETMAPLTDREAPTNPHASRSAMLPPRTMSVTVEPPMLDELLSQAIKIVAEAGGDIRKEREERRAFEASQLKIQGEILAAVTKADENGTKNYELLRNEILRLKDADSAQDRRLFEGDERFDRIERSIGKLRDEMVALVARASEDTARRIAVLEVELAEARANARAAQTPAAATP